jgi:hypothetical protein
VDAIHSGILNLGASKTINGKRMFVTRPLIDREDINGFPQVDNRIRFGLRSALNLKIIKPGSTIIAVQGWKGGLGHTNTLRILSVPTDFADLELQPLGSN